MSIPYGFDCYSFAPNELTYFEPNISAIRWSTILPYSDKISAQMAHQGHLDPTNGQKLDPYVRFTRKNEHYTDEQLGELIRSNKLNESQVNEKIFCGIKIQIGIGVVTNFMKRGLQYRKPISGHSYFKNGTWTGIVSGLTVNSSAPTSYDVAFGNFLAYDEEFPYMNFGPFYAVESKLVFLTGGSRRIEASSFGTNISTRIWITILSTLLLLALLASLRVHWQQTKYRALRVATMELIDRRLETRSANVSCKEPISSRRDQYQDEGPKLPRMILDFFLIYFTMLLNKPSDEFDELVWPKEPIRIPDKRNGMHFSLELLSNNRELLRSLMQKDPEFRKQCTRILGDASQTPKRWPLPTSVRVVSYLWSAACFVMASIYSGELLAVILLHADTDIDTIQQLINSKPLIEPVIRQDDFTYTLMLRSLDPNLLKLHNITKMIPRPEVYTRRFIESVSDRKQALLGDDELIETIYDIYHKYFPLHRSKVTYLQYPISIMYRKDLSPQLERLLRRGVVQIFEMGLVHRWYQAQKDTYKHFYDRFEKDQDNQTSSNQDPLVMTESQRYKPLSISNLYSLFYLLLLCFFIASLVLVAEIIHSRLMANHLSSDE